MDPDHHQKLITSRGSPLAHSYQVWSTSVSAFVSYPVYRATERSHNFRIVSGGKYCINEDISITASFLLELHFW